MKTIKATIARDLNGNKIVKLSGGISIGKGFRIQTNGNLPYCHMLNVGDILEHDKPHTQRGLTEIVSYVFEHGTDAQRAFLGLENTKKQSLSAVL